MILVIPKIEISNGQCLDLIKGITGTENLYQDLCNEPENLCGLLRRENSKALHIIDRDSLENKPNQTNMEVVLKISDFLDIPVQYYGKLNNYDDCKYLLDHNIYRIVVNDLAFSNPEMVASLVDEYTGSRVVFKAHFNEEGMILKPNGDSITDTQMGTFVNSFGARRIIISKDSWSEKFSDKDIEFLKQLPSNPKIKLTIECFLSNSKTLWKLNKLTSYGIDSVILGKDIFENTFPCQKIWRQIESELE